MKKTNLFRFAPALAAVALCLAAALPAARGDAVTDWNAHLEDALKNAAVSAGLQGRIAAIVHVAIYDAVNGIEPRYTPYFVRGHGPRNANASAAAIQAGYTTLKALFPAQATTLDAHLATSLAALPQQRHAHRRTSNGRAWGEYVANLVLNWRTNDGINAPTPGYFGGNAPGLWRSIAVGTNADGTLPAIIPQMPTLEPFAMTSPDQFRPGPPPALTSELYTRDFNEVKAIGRFDSTMRTSDQTQLALLWQASSTAEENNIVRQVLPPGNSLVQNARIFALLNIQFADGLIAGFDAKYVYNFWRPHHAVRLADTDGNPDTEADPNWKALFVAPRHQEYFSNHSVATGGFMHMLASFVGDEHPCTLASRDYPSFSWRFNRISEVATQVKEARVWGGIHFRFSCEVGEAVGIQIADYILNNFLLPLHHDDDDDDGKDGGKDGKDSRKK